MNLEQLAENKRELPIAIAHCLASCKAGNQPRLRMLNRMFIRLYFPEQTACKAELTRCKQARRGRIFAAVQTIRSA